MPPSRVLPPCLCLAFACASIETAPAETQHPAIRLPGRFEQAPAALPAPRSLGEKPPDAPAPDGPPRHGYLPDPPALSQRGQWRYLIRYDRGVVSAAPPTFACLPHRRASPRRLGRFAFELWVGFELVERIRFDFPLLATEAPEQAARPGERAPRRPIRPAPSFAPGAKVSLPLLVPASLRATRAQILDRATGQTVELPWPPVTPSAHPGPEGACHEGPGSAPARDDVSG